MSQLFTRNIDASRGESINHFEVVADIKRLHYSNRAHTDRFGPKISSFGLLVGNVFLTQEITIEIHDLHIHK